MLEKSLNRCCTISHRTLTLHVRFPRSQPQRQGIPMEYVLRKNLSSAPQWELLRQVQSSRWLISASHNTTSPPPGRTKLRSDAFVERFIATPELFLLQNGSGTNSAEHPLGHLAIGSCPIFTSYSNLLSTSAEVALFNRVPIGPRFAANRGALPTRLNDIMPNYFCRGAYHKRNSPGLIRWNRS